MPRKRKSERRDSKPPKTPKPVFASPFKVLKKMLKEREQVPSPAGRAMVSTPRPAAQPPEPVADDASLIRRAFEGVRPLGNSRATRVPLQPPANRSVVSEDAEVLAQLSDLISGQGAFDVTETDEYIEGARVGLDPRLLTRLRRGEFAVQSHIDLHGMIQPAAQQALAAFIAEAVQKGLRTVLVVHGRGRGSPGGRPVLKHAVATWLSRRSLSGYVLAFATARPADGGAGAMYVLLRRERRRAPFEVLQGAKRRD